MAGTDSREALRSRALGRVSDGIVSLNTDLEFTFVNARAEQLLDATEETLRGTCFWEAFPEGAESVAETSVSNAIDTGQDQTFERYSERLEGWFEVRIYPGDDGVSVFLTDISESKERELELERYEQLIEALPVAVGINTTAGEGRFEFVNQAAVELFEASSRAELREHSPRDVYASADERRVVSDRLEETGSVDQYETRLTTFEGETLLGSVTAELTEIDGENSIIRIIEDISDRKARDQELTYKRAAIEDAPIGISLSDPDRDDNPLFYVNDRFEEVTGFAPEEVYGRNCRFLQGDDTEAEPVSAIRDAIAANESVTVDLRNYRKDGEQFWNRVSIAPVTAEHGERFFVGFQQDITEEKNRERELEASKERIAEQNRALESFTEIATDRNRTSQQQITELLDLGATYLDLDIAILSAVDGSEYTVQNVVGPVDGIEPGTTLDLSETYCSLVYDADEPVSFHRPDDGGVRDHPAYRNRGFESYIGVPVRVDGERYGTLNFSRPDARQDRITDGEESFVQIMAQWIGRELERQQRQQELERTSEFLRETQEVAHIGGWEVDLRSDRLRWSDEVYRIHGLPVDANLTPEDAIEFYHPDDRETISAAFERLTTDGKPYDVELRVVTADDDVRWVRTRGAPRYENDEIVSVRGTFQDITERKSYQEELERTQQIIENSTDIATVIDPEGTITYVSPAVEEVLGYDPDELIGTDGFGYQSEETRADVAEALEYVLDNPAETKTVQTRFRRADGSWCWIESTVRNRVDHDVINGVLVSSRDISERKEREQELVHQERLLDALFEFAPVHLFVKDDQYRHLWMSSALVDDPERYLGKRDVDVDRGAPEEFSTEALADDRRVIDDGQRIIDIEEHNQELDRWFLTSKVPWYDGDGSVAGLLGYSVDITDRKEREKELQMQNERLDEFSSVVAHDLRNPLNVARGRTAILEQRCGDEHPEHLRPLTDALERMENIIDDTLTLARKGDTVGEMDSIQIADLVGTCWAGVETTDATLEIPDRFTIRGDRERLRHVFENLFRNAVEHGGDNVSVRVGRAGENGIYVEDDGPGIPAGERDEVFDAGYTSETDGTGFGLAIVKRIAQAHNWEVAITDGPDGGARFEFDTAGLVSG